MSAAIQHAVGTTLEPDPTKFERLTGKILCRDSYDIAIAIRDIGERCRSCHGARDPGLR